MASAVTTQKIGSKFSFEALFHDPDTASAQYVTSDGGTTFYWRDMRDYEWFGVAAANSTLTGNGLTAVEIWAADDTSGTNAQLIVASGTLSGTAVGNGAFVECTAAQIREVSAAQGKTLRYVTAKITVANSADEAAVAFLRGLAKHPQLNLTPATF
jgi:hypothetical protein